jgi:putative membrane protein
MIGNIVLDVGDFHHMMDWGHMNWWGFPFLGLWFIGILIAIIVIVFIIIQGEKKEEKEIMNDAQKILDERYAKGEMTRKDYLQAKDDIRNFNQK